MSNVPAQPPPPPVLYSARVLSYAVLGEDVIYTGRNLILVDGKPLGSVPRLAICRDLHDDSILLQYCDDEWNPLGVSNHGSVEDARRYAELNYAGSDSCWVSSSYTDADVERELDEVWGDERCSFCGKRPFQVDRLFHGKAAYICDVCIRKFYDKVSPIVSGE
jgi:hypothetical protein